MQEDKKQSQINQNFETVCHTGSLFMFCFNLALADRNIHVKFSLKRVLEFEDVDILKTTTSFC